MIAVTDECRRVHKQKEAFVEIPGAVELVELSSSDPSGATIVLI